MWIWGTGQGIICLQGTRGRRSPNQQICGCTVSPDDDGCSGMCNETRITCLVLSVPVLDKEGRPCVVGLIPHLAVCLWVRDTNPLGLHLSHLQNGRNPYLPHHVIWGCPV